jgi:hypothetical protein
MTNLYGLRWDAPHETAYPSIFILDKNGKILFQKISHSHGDRTSAEEVLGQLKTTQPGRFPCTARDYCLNTCNMSCA